jgi:hypothetical protein
MPGAWCARSRAWWSKTRALVTTVTPETPGIPRAMVLTVSFVLAPETVLCCLRPPRDAKHHRDVDVSVGTSGPHDFAVRDLRFVDHANPGHRIRAQRVVTIAIRPFWWARTGGACRDDLPVDQNGKFLPEGLDTADKSRGIVRTKPVGRMSDSVIRRSLRSYGCAMAN